MCVLNYAFVILRFATDFILGCIIPITLIQRHDSFSLPFVPFRYRPQLVVEFGTFLEQTVGSDGVLRILNQAYQTIVISVGLLVFSIHLSY